MDEPISRYTDPIPARELTVGQLRFEPGGRLAVGNQIPNFPHASTGGFCRDTVRAGIYHWSLHGNVLAIRIVSYHQCADRNTCGTAPSPDETDDSRPRRHA